MASNQNLPGMQRNRKNTIHNDEEKNHPIKANWELAEMLEWGNGIKSYYYDISCVKR